MMVKEQLDGKLVEILASIQGAVGKASDFAIAELPDIAQSYIAYGRATATAAVVLGAMLAAYCIWAGMRAEYHHRMYWATSGAQEAEHRSKNAGFALSAVASGFIAFVLLALNTNSALLVWFAPKVWLLKEIARMLK